MNKIELIQHFTEQLKKVLVSHGADSEHFTTAFYVLQGAKIGLPLEELFDWANAEAKRLHQIALDKLNLTTDASMNAQTELNVLDVDKWKATCNSLSKKTNANSGTCFEVFQRKLNLLINNELLNMPKDQRDEAINIAVLVGYER